MKDNRETRRHHRIIRETEHPEDQGETRGIMRPQRIPRDHGDTGVTKETRGTEATQGNRRDTGREGHGDHGSQRVTGHEKSRVTQRYEYTE